MRSSAVVERQISGQAFMRDRDSVIGVQIDLLVFDCPPEPFNKDVVPPCTFAVHADLDISTLQRLDEVDGCEIGCPDPYS